MSASTTNASSFYGGTNKVLTRKGRDYEQPCFAKSISHHSSLCSSRFFCSSMDAPDDIPKGEVHQPSQKSGVDCQTMKTESAEAKDCSSASPGSAETGRADLPSLRTAQTSCFSWSKNFAERSGTPSPVQSVALLKQFHRHTSGNTASQDCMMSGSQILISTFGKESDEESSLLKGQGYSSEQKSNELSQSNLDCPENSSVPSGKATDAKVRSVPSFMTKAIDKISSSLSRSYLVFSLCITIFILRNNFW